MYRGERVAKKRAMTEGNALSPAGPGFAPNPAPMTVTGTGMGTAPGITENRTGVSAASEAGSGWVAGVARQESGNVGVPLPPPAYVQREEKEMGGIEMGNLGSGDGEKGSQTRMGERMARGSWPSTIASWEK